MKASRPALLTLPGLTLPGLTGPGLAGPGLAGLALGLLLAAALPESALAHEGAGVVGGFASGFSHPIFGLDHALAMLAVGIWGAFLGQPAIWLLPVSFPLVMAFAGVLGGLGAPLPFVEPGIALSVLGLGGLIALAARPPLWFAFTVIGLFALFHGHAHGTELPGAANPLAFGIGFVISTGLLHLMGIGTGLLARWPQGVLLLRGGGAAIAATGLYLFVTPFLE